MKGMIMSRGIATGVVVILSLVCVFGMSWAAEEFSADFISKSSDPRDMPGQGKIYMKGNRMRIESSGAVTISNPDKGVLWIIIAVCLAVEAARPKMMTRGTAVWAGVLFFLFGISDFVETQTEGFWQPPWLFAWKAVCGAGLFAVFVRWRRWRRRRSEEGRKASADCAGPTDGE